MDRRRLTAEPGPVVPSSSDVHRITSSVAVSALGTWSYNVGIAVYAYQETQSTAWVAAATVGRYVPALVITWLGSRWADRYDRRTVAVVADVVCALTMLLLTAVAALHGPLVLAIALAALSSGVARIQSAAALSAAADLVVESQLTRATALISTSDAVATAAGPAIAALVLAVTGPPALFLINGLTFAASAVLLAGVRAAAPRRAPGATARGPAPSDDLYRAARRSVWPLLASRTIAALVYGADVVLLAVVATDQLQQGTRGYGWLLAAAGTGGLVAAGFLRRGKGLGRAWVLTSTGLVLYALPLLVLATAPDLAGSLVTQVVRGFGCVLVTFSVIATIQRGVPSQVSGRVFGLSHALTLTGTCVGALAAPLLLKAFGLTTTLALVAVVPVLLQALLVPRLVGFDRAQADNRQALDPRISLLGRLSLFQDVSRWTLYDVADRAQTQEVRAGTDLVTQGEEPDALYVLVTGEAIVTQDGPGGRRTLRTLSAPDYFGEIGIIHQVPRTATVTAVDSCTVWRIPAPVFLAAADQAGFSGALTENVRLRFDPVLARAGDQSADQ